jgi:hypothetical protein
MRPNKLSVKDKALFAKYLALDYHELSPYAFENILLWRGLFEIEWLEIEGSLCVFFKDRFGCFLYLPPLAKKINPGILREVFRILNKFNKNKEVSRIENVEAKDLSFYKDIGYVCRIKSYDYLCKREDLVNLQGAKFKSKRAGFNYFIKHYKFEYKAFSLKNKSECLELSDTWVEERKSQNKDPIYQGMLEDSRVCLKNALDAYPDLGLMGRVVRLEGKIKAFAFGFKLNVDTFCILYEVTDLTIKGLAQFIFRKFCSELKDYKYINIMDDSGLENLKKVKLSYRPARLIPAYIVTRRDNPCD